ncbi:Tim44 domain-containing protein [Aromatoleum diolicum]|uniref:Tim44 domain-containing protein n=1 Tax=Aromatoleum diolicum TaxID=75796 RepID=A0ABX1QB62_9RHOO|nr:TIM44-like domain-containing protein [Aromatoleum diolicum]NMG74712.1 Tim44 domain-containing protein [Aromatoleum diolicum]
MKRILLSLFALVLSVGLTVTDAEAKRLGGSKSIGMQRDATPQAPASAPARTADAPTGAAGAAATQAPRKNSWMGPVAGLAAGLGLAALASHLGMGEGFANMLMIGLLVIGAVLAFRFLARKRAQAQGPAMQYAGMGAGGGSMPLPAEPAPMSTPLSASTPGAASHVSGPSLPAGFDAEGFVRQAKLNFLRLQAANDAGNLADLREFVSPEMFAELQLQLGERGAATQQTEVVDLQGAIVECVEDAQRYIVSVRFHGLIREEAGAAPDAFSEIWHLTKPTDGSKGWVVAGIQQLN